MERDICNLQKYPSFIPILYLYKCTRILNLVFIIKCTISFLNISSACLNKKTISNKENKIFCISLRQKLIGACLVLASENALHFDQKRTSVEIPNDKKTTRRRPPLQRGISRNKSDPKILPVKQMFPIKLMRPFFILE